MKTTTRKVSLFMSAITLFLTVSCSSDDSTDNTGNQNNPAPTSYNLLPLKINNSWTYDVSQNDGTNTTTNEDVITVEGTTTINTKSYHDMKMSNGSLGSMSAMLDRNYFRTNTGVYYMQGNFELPLSQLGGTDISIELNDVELINQSKASGTILSTLPGTLSQTIQGIPLSINYTLKTIQKDNLATHNVKGTPYNNVVQANIVVTASVSATIQGININLISNQDIYIIQNYYADGIGLIDSDATFKYDLNDIPIPGFTLPIPDSRTVTTAQDIKTYTVVD